MLERLSVRRGNHLLVNGRVVLGVPREDQLQSGELGERLDFRPKALPQLRVRRGQVYNQLQVLQRGPDACQQPLHKAEIAEG